MSTRWSHSFPFSFRFEGRYLHLLKYTKSILHKLKDIGSIYNKKQNWSFACSWCQSLNIIYARKLWFCLSFSLKLISVLHYILVDEEIEIQIWVWCFILNCRRWLQSNSKASPSISEPFRLLRWLIVWTIYSLPSFFFFGKEALTQSWGLGNWCRKVQMLPLKYI